MQMENTITYWVCILRQWNSPNDLCGEENPTCFEDQ